MNPENNNQNPNTESESVPSFESALSQLQDIVKKMESGAMPLDAAVLAYERGMKLKEFLDNTLKTAELKIEQLKTE